MRHSLFPCIYFALLVAGTACSDGHSGDGHSRDGTIPIGYIGPFSNDQRISYLASTIREINEAGGVDLPDGHHDLELVAEDHGGTTAGGVAALHRLADKGVTVSVDPSFSSMLLGDALDHSDGVGIAARDRGIVVISGGATAPALTDLDDDDFVWRTVPSDVVQGAIAADTLTQQGIATAAILYRDDPYGNGLSETFRREFEANGGQIVGTASYSTDNADQLDFTPQLGAIFQNKPQAVLFVTFDEVFSIAAQIAAGTYLSSYSGNPPIFVGTDGFYDPTNILQNMPGVVLEHLQGTAPNPDKQSADYRKIVDLAAAQGIGEDNIDVGRYDAVLLLALGIQAAGSADGSAVKAQLQNISRADPGDVVIHPGEWAKAKATLLEGKTINYEGGSGGIEFSAKGDPTVGFIELWKVVRGANGYGIDGSTNVPFQL